MVPLRGAARPGQAAALHGRLRRRPEEGRLRLPGVRPRQDRQQEVRRRAAARPPTLVKNFNWTNDDQNVVAGYITRQDVPDEAGKKWADANEAKWKAWIGQ